MTDDNDEVPSDSSPVCGIVQDEVIPYRRYKPKLGFHTWGEMLSWRSPSATKCVADAMRRYGRPKLAAILDGYVRAGSAPLFTDALDFWKASGPEGRAWCEDEDRLYRGSVEEDECILEYAVDESKGEVMCLLTHIPTEEVVCAAVVMEVDTAMGVIERRAADLAWEQLHQGKLVGV